MTVPSPPPAPAAHHGRAGVPPVILVPTLVGLVIGTLFVTIFLAAFHTPEPHDLPVGIVGPAGQVEGVERALAATAPGTIAFTGYASAAAARDAVEHRRVYGAYVLPGQGTDARLLYAGANGPAVTSTLEGVFGAVTGPAALRTQDVVPTSSGDTRGLSVFYAGFGLVLAGYLFGLISFQMAPRLHLRARLLSLAAFSVLGGATAALIAGRTGFGALPGDLAAVMAVTILLAMAVGSATLLLMRVGGPAGTLLSSLVLLILGNATSGGILPPAYLPGWLRPLSDVLPVGLGVRALQGVSYFGGDGYARGLVLLVVWAVAGIAAVHALDVAARRRGRVGAGKGLARPAPAAPH
ncbi:ABC transporter permease [Actinomadura sp. ATCC 31491]|uniref:ABC transporter permease n=1 Tax=Actinomadura luzonensis TaxID=2805427 RepID=A0ABT0FTI8_9ACTN|nr:ABC transporter permease [Actinomadura luzonensis]MCK2215631.1 ABC transporter permease [Actinomadura luzonensis]